MNRVLFTLLAVTLLASCAADPLYEYAKPGGTRKQLDAARSACSTPAIAIPQGAKLSPGEKAIIGHLKNQQQHQFAECMKSKGYELVEID